MRLSGGFEASSPFGNPIPSRPHHQFPGRLPRCLARPRPVGGDCAALFSLHLRHCSRPLAECFRPLFAVAAAAPLAVSIPAFSAATKASSSSSSISSSSCSSRRWSVPEGKSQAADRHVPLYAASQHLALRQERGGRH